MQTGEKNKRKNLIFSKVSSKIKVTEKRKCAKQEKNKRMSTRN